MSIISDIFNNFGSVSGIGGDQNPYERKALLFVAGMPLDIYDSDISSENYDAANLEIARDDKSMELDYKGSPASLTIQFTQSWAGGSTVELNNWRSFKQKLIIARNAMSQKSYTDLINSLAGAIGGKLGSILGMVNQIPFLSALVTGVLAGNYVSYLSRRIVMPICSIKKLGFSMDPNNEKEVITMELLAFDLATYNSPSAIADNIFGLIGGAFK
jgi:hypothetical protein